MLAPSSLPAGFSVVSLSPSPPRIPFLSHADLPPPRSHTPAVCQPARPSTRDIPQATAGVPAVLRWRRRRRDCRRARRSVVRLRGGRPCRRHGAVCPALCWRPFRGRRRRCPQPHPSPHTPPPILPPPPRASQRASLCPLPSWLGRPTCCWKKVLVRCRGHRLRLCCACVLFPPGRCANERARRVAARLRHAALSVLGGVRHDPPPPPLSVRAGGRWGVATLAHPCIVRRTRSSRTMLVDPSLVEPFALPMPTPCASAHTHKHRRTHESPLTHPRTL
jgi:hypothetical protein